MVRDCSIDTDSEPLVLAVYHEKKVYNVKIRFIESTSKYVLGTSQQSNDVSGRIQFNNKHPLSLKHYIHCSSLLISPQMFDSVADMIRFHSIFPIILISGRNMPGSRCPENCLLTCPVTKRDVDQLLQ